MIGLARVGCTGVVGSRRRVLEDPACGVLVAVSRVLDELLFGSLETLGLALTRLGQRTLRPGTGSLFV